MLDAPNVGDWHLVYTFGMRSEYAVHTAISLDFSHTISRPIPSLSHRQDLGEAGTRLDNIFLWLGPQIEPRAVQSEGEILSDHLQHAELIIMFRRISSCTSWLI